MDITIIGTGNMGRGIATRALAGGQSVTLLGTDTAKAQALAQELSGDVRAGQVGDPLTRDVVILALWYAAVDDVLRGYRDQLEGKGAGGGGVNSTGVTLERYDDPVLKTDEKGIHELGDGRVAWFSDPDGNTCAIEEGSAR